MIVLDASVVVELIANGPLAPRLRADAALRDGNLAVPHLLDVEVLSALRRMCAGRQIDAFDSHRWMRALIDLPAERFAHQPLLPRAWELRHNFTTYDAMYIALAEELRATLYTCDAKLSSGHRAPVKLFAA